MDSGDNSGLDRPGLPNWPSAWWRRALARAGIWLGFAVAVYLLAGFLSLVVITFIVCYINNSFSEYLIQRFGWSRRIAVSSLYLAILVALVIGVVVVLPRAAHEGKRLYDEIPDAYEKARAWTENAVDSSALRSLQAYGITQNLNETIKMLAKQVGTTLNALVKIGFHVFLSLIFSFLILFDLPKMKAGARVLATSRLGPAYDEVGPHLVKFSEILGRVFEAQIVIASVNTVFTFAGLLLLEIPYSVVLSLGVFFGGLIPVLGVFLSSIPIVLVAFKVAGIVLSLKVILLITLIHILEAYVLNPQIMGEHLRIHPVVVLGILLIGETYFGIWGLLLGVPVSIYIFRDLLEAAPA